MNTKMSSSYCLGSRKRGWKKILGGIINIIPGWKHRPTPPYAVSGTHVALCKLHEEMSKRFLILKTMYHGFGETLWKTSQAF